MGSRTPNPKPRVQRSDGADDMPAGIVASQEDEDEAKKGALRRRKNAKWQMKSQGPNQTKPNQTIGK